MLLCGIIIEVVINLIKSDNNICCDFKYSKSKILLTIKVINCLMMAFYNYKGWYLYEKC